MLLRSEDSTWSHRKSSKISLKILESRKCDEGPFDGDSPRLGLVVIWVRSRQGGGSLASWAYTSRHTSSHLFGVFPLATVTKAQLESLQYFYQIRAKGE